MKISIEQANKLLQEVLNDVEVVESDADTDVDIAYLQTELKDNIVQSARTEIEAEIAESAKSAELGKNMGSLRSAIARSFGLNKSELEGKEIADIVKIAKERYDQANGQTKSEWEKERDQLYSEMEEKEAKIREEYETKLQGERNKYIRRDIQSAILGITEKIPRKKGDLNEHADIALYKLEQQYEVKYNEETKSIELYKDGKPAMNGTKRISAEEYVRTVFDKAGISETDTRNVKPSDVKSGVDTGVSVSTDVDELKHVAPNMRKLVAEARQAEA